MTSCTCCCPCGVCSLEHHAGGHACRLHKAPAVSTTPKLLRGQLDAAQVAMLESCRDRNVVQFLGSCSDGPQTLLVTE
jgi:hypothetical protein